MQRNVTPCGSYGLVIGDEKWVLVELSGRDFLLPLVLEWMAVRFNLSSIYCGFDLNGYKPTSG